MGRRKIEIRAIRDDRNRSVTFLKRKGGLFKKAYELGVLCSVDVAVIVFGNNKKLYQFSSGDIQETLTRYQYHNGAPHEHKGPADFEGKGGGVWEDEDDEDAGTNDISPPNSHMRDTPEPMPAGHNLHNQAAYQHMRQVTASASPPMRNISLHRSMTPQSQGYSRPGSRMAGGPRRTGSGFNVSTPQPPSSMPHAHSHGPPGPPPPHHHSAPHHHPDFAYNSNTQYYQPPPHFSLPLPPLQSNGHPPPPPPQSRTSHPQGPPHDPPYPQHHHHHAPPHMQAPPPQGPPPYHIHPQYAEEHRHQSVPPAMPSQHSPPSAPPQLEVQTAALDRNKSPQMSHTSAQSGESGLLQPRAVPPHSSSTHSIFTPIDDSRSLLAQHWGGSSAISSGTDITRARSTDGHIQSPPPNNIDPQIARESAASSGHARSRSASAASPVQTAKTLTRSSTMQSDAKKPRLKVQIPSEKSDAGGDSAIESNAMTTGPPTAAMSTAQPKSGVVLPPPSPSTRNPLLSAGATGPYNPFAFAKPQIPASSTTTTNNNNTANSSSTSNNNNNNTSTTNNSGREPLETPLSALPSRVMDSNMLPSPSDIWNSVWGKNANDNMMPSPINFQSTPIFSSAPGFRELATGGSSADDRKRRADTEAAPAAGLEKRIKT